MLRKSLKYFLATIFFLLSTVLALSDIVIVPKKKPNLKEDDIIKNASSNFIFPKQKPGSKKKEITTKYVHATSKGHEAVQIALGLQLLNTDFVFP